jgi:hypothetical protein
MKELLAIVVLAAVVSTNSSAQYKAPTTGSSTQYYVSTSKTDADNCPLISVTNTGTKPYRLTVKYTHSGTTIGKSRSSESNTLTWGNFKPGESKDFEINPGANCQTPNRLTIDEVKAELY